MSLIRTALAVQGAAVGAVRRTIIRLRPESVATAPWEPPVGPRAVGVHDLALAGFGSSGVDGMLRLWYPAVAGTGRGRRAYGGGPHEQDVLARGLSPQLTRAGTRTLGARVTASDEDADPATEGAPVVFFSHGFGGFVGQNTHLCEHLAAAGYVVVSVAYPAGAGSISAPDGSERVMTKADQNRVATSEFVDTVAALLTARTAEKEDAALDRAAHIRSLEAEDEAWSGHLVRVLDALVDPDARAASLDATARRILDPADWSRIALVGMSFGGSTSGNVAHADARVSAAVNLDGLQQGSTLRLTDIRVPMLAMSAGSSRMRSGRVVNDLHYAAPDGGTNVQRVYVPDAQHLGFTDLVEVGSPLVRRLLGVGTIDPARMIVLVNDAVLGFLDPILRPQPADVAASDERA